MGKKIDLHNHSYFSKDSSADPEELVAAAINAGLDGIAFTEHNSYTASDPIEAIRGKYKDKLMIFRGAEYIAAEGHLLVFGVTDDFIFNDAGLYAPAQEIIDAVNSIGGAVIVPHPFREWARLRIDISELKGISAIEAFNGHNSLDENLKAYRAAEVLGLPTTGGSDSHVSMQIGVCYTEFFDDVKEDNIAEILKYGSYQGVIGVQ